MGKVTKKRILAAVMTLLMVVTLLPIEFLGGVLQAKAATTYELTPDESMSRSYPLSTTVQQLGTDSIFYTMGGFSVASSSGENNNKKAGVAKVSLTSGGVTADTYVVSIANGKVDRYYSENATEKNQIINALKVVVSVKSNVTVSYAAKDLKNSPTFGLYTATETTDQDGKVTSVTSPAVYLSSPACTTAYALETYTFENVAAGTYYLGFSANGGYISYVKVAEATPASGSAPVVTSATAEKNADADSIDVSWTLQSSASDYGDGQVAILVSSDGGTTYSDTPYKTVSADTTSISYPLTASGSYKFKVYGTFTDDNKQTSTTSAVETPSTAISYTLPLATPSVKTTSGAESGKVTVKWDEVKEATSYKVNVYQGGSIVSDKCVTDIASTATSQAITGLTDGTEYSFEVIAYRNSESTTSDKVTATPSTPLVFTGLTTATLTDQGTYSVGSAVEKEVKIDDNWSIIGTSGKTYAIKSSTKTSTDGYLFENCFNPGGKGVASSTELYRALKLTVTEKSYIVIYGTSSNASTVDISVVTADKKYTGVGTITLGAKDDNNPVSPSVALNLDAGSYYIYSGGNCYIWGIALNAGEAPRGPWDEVEDPVLSNLDTTGAKISVDLDAAFGTDGGDKAMVTLYQNGYEVSTVTATESGTITFSPTVSGDFTIKAVLSRSGEADKVSNVISVTGFIKPIDTPTITWLNNLGGGSVYVDWDNVSCDSFSVLYKKSGDADYTTAAENITAGNYTLTGLTEGETYEVKVVAHKATFDDVEDTDTITVGDASQQWYVAAIGSATSGKMTIDGASYSLGNDQKDATAPTDSTVVTVDAASNGKVADSEDGFFYYYTKINPNTENFTLTATFKVTDASAIDNQTGFGIYAVDKAGLGTKDTKYFNSVSVGNFKADTGAHQNVSRLTTGYVSYDTESNADVTRNLDRSNVFSKQNSGDTLNNGDTFTYTLTKTNDSYVASMVGATGTVIWEGTGSLAVQEDGSLCIGVMSARQVAVEISNISFSKSAGTLSQAVESKTTPAFNVYSSKVSAVENYEFIGAANVDGELNFYVDGVLRRTLNIKANKAVTLPVTLWNYGGEANEMSYTFTPSESGDYANYDEISGRLSVVWNSIGNAGQTLVVSPTGRVRAEGTMDDPLDVQTALNMVQPGQTVLFLDGTYYPTSDYVVPRSISGTSSKPITLTAQTAGGVTIDGSQMTSSNGLMTLVGSYIKVYGMDFCNSPGKGFAVCGNNNTVELCNFYKNKNTGLQISRYAGEPNDSNLWPSNNLIKNCDSYDNCDDGRNDADGFAAKLTCGEGNTFYGCTSHNNIDDGWDLFAKSTTGPIGVVTIENCVAYSNGWLSYEDPEVVGYGEGNGFKLGGENMYGAHILRNCISYNNAGKGITSNSGPDCRIYNCTVYNNSLKGSSYNVSLYTKSSNTKAWVLSGVISIATNGKTAAELGASNGVVYSLKSSTNYLFDGSKSYNSEGVEATEDWFVSTDVSVLPTRNADGTLDMHGLLELNSSAPSDSGARLVTTGTAVSKQPSTGSVIGSTDSSYDDDDDDDELSSTDTTSNGLTVVGESVAVSVPDGTVVKNAAGEILTSGSVYVKAEGKNAESQAKIEKAMSDSRYTLAEGAQVEYYEVSFVDANGNPLTLEGSMNVTFKFPSGTNATDYSYKVLHLLSSGKLDVMDPVVSDAGITVTVTEFSPFAVVYLKNSGSATAADIVLKSPTTGDTNAVVLWVFLMGVAIMVFGACNAAKKRKTVEK